MLRIGKTRGVCKARAVVHHSNTKLQIRSIPAQRLGHMSPAEQNQPAGRQKCAGIGLFSAAIVLGIQHQFGGRAALHCEIDQPHLLPLSLIPACYIS